MDKLRRITFREFNIIFANELRQLRNNGMEFVAYKQTDSWQRIYFDYDFDWSEDRDRAFVVELISPLDSDDIWGVHVLKREATFTYDSLKAIVNFIDALKKHPFKEIVR